MIYEVRTYILRPGAVAEFEERFAKRLRLREKHSKLGAFWHTDFGQLNQVVHIYPYDDLRHRTSVRAALAQDTAMQQLPGGGDLIVAQEAEIMNPAPFMHARGSRDYRTGNVYEMRTYAYAPATSRRCWRGGPTPSRRARSSPRWRPAGRANSAGSTSSFTPGCTGISTSAPASVRNPVGPAGHGQHRPGCGRSSRKPS
jgi:hypothetical protein